MPWPKSVLIHIGCSGPFITSRRPPECLEYCIRQYFAFNKGRGDLYILTDRENISHLPRNNQVCPVPLEDYESDKVARFNALYNYDPRNFWTVAVTRLIYLENFLRDNDLKHVYHLENDVLVYFDISEYHHVFKQLYGDKIAMTPGDSTKVMTGFMYIDNYHPLELMTEFFIETLAAFGVQGTQHKYNLDMVHDMSLAAVYSKEEGASIARLPILPFGEFSENFDKFNAVFDPAGWGQFVGGTRDKGPGAKCLCIGDVLRQHPSYTVVWETEDGLRRPYFSYDDNLVKINTLHIHSKNLLAFMSTQQGGC